MALPLPAGPAYWQARFGIPSLSDFRTACEGLIPSFPLPGAGYRELAIVTAYYTPLSPSGLFLTAALTAKGFHEDSPSGPATVTAGSLADLLNQSIAQESTVAGLIVPSCFQVTIQMVAGGHRIENVVGVKNASGTAAGAAAAVKTAWEIASGPMASHLNLVAMTNYHAVDVSSATGTIADLASTQAGAVATGSFATRGACALVKWNGGNRSRSTRGRLYWGPASEALINPDGATLTSAAITALNTAFTNFRNSLNSSGYPLVVLSRTLSQSFDVTQHTVESQVATQRRRIRG